MPNSPTSPTSPIKLAVLVSGGGTTLQNLIDRIADKSLDATLSIVVGSRADLPALQRASAAKIMNFAVKRSDYPDVAEFSRQVFKLIADAGVDLVCLAGWLCLLEIPSAYAEKVVNIHPALLPSFGGKGMYGSKVHQAVLNHGCKVSGCTVHFVDGEYDNGPIISQRTCPVMDDDSAETLGRRVFEEEIIAYPEAIRLFAEGRLRIDGRRVRVS